MWNDPDIRVRFALPLVTTEAVEPAFRLFVFARMRRNGIYEITVTNQKGARIALFRGRSYRIDGHVVSTD